MGLKLFIDTMAYLHYRPLRELHLNELTSEISITIVIPRITLRELDKHKNSHKSQTVRERAKRVVAELAEAIHGKTNIAGTDLSVEFFGVHPTKEIESLGFDPLWSDDILLATVSEYRKTAKGVRVAVLTQDTGLRLGSLEHGIEIFELRDEFRLADEPDPIEKENRELRQELARVKQNRPDVNVKFMHIDPPSNFAKFLIKPFPGMDQAVLAEKLAKVRAKFPLHDENSNDVNKMDLSVAASLSPFSNEINSREWGKYNLELMKYYEKMENYFHQLHRLEEVRDLALPFKLGVVNFGTAPADDVDVILHFPDGFDLTTKDGLPEDPERPVPPDKPLSALEKMALRSVPPNIGSLFRPPTIPMFKAPTTFKIKKTNSYEVTEIFSRVKHHTTAKLRRMYVCFRSFHEAKSFKATYEIRVANALEPFTGELHFVIEKSAGVW